MFTHAASRAAKTVRASFLATSASGAVTRTTCSEDAMRQFPFRPRQNKCLSDRMKRFPCEMAIEAWHFSPTLLVATMPLNFGFAEITAVSPDSERKYILPSASTGDAE